MQANKNLMKKLRALRRTEDALTQQSRNYSRACEAAREFRDRLKARIEQLEQTIVREQLEQLARYDSETYGAKLRDMRSKLDDTKAQLGDSQAEEDEIREEWSKLNSFLSPLIARLDDALQRLGKRRSDIGGVPFDDRKNARVDVVLP